MQDIKRQYKSLYLPDVFQCVLRLWFPDKLVLQLHFRPSDTVQTAVLRISEVRKRQANPSKGKEFVSAVLVGGREVQSVVRLPLTPLEEIGAQEDAL